MIGDAMNESNTARARRTRDECRAWPSSEMWFGFIANALDAAVTEEREACAKLADNDVDGDGKLIAQAIRQRSLVGL